MPGSRKLLPPPVDPDPDHRPGPKGWSFLTWAEVKARYMASDLSPQALADELGIGRARVVQRARKEEWAFERRKINREAVLNARKHFEKGLTDRIARFLQLRANSAIEALEELRTKRLAEAKHWTCVEWAAYSRAEQIQDERLERALGMHLEKTTEGVPEVRFAWLPQDLRPQIQADTEEEDAPAPITKIIDGGSGNGG